MVAIKEKGSDECILIDIDFYSDDIIDCYLNNDLIMFTELTNSRFKILDKRVENFLAKYKK